MNERKMCKERIEEAWERHKKKWGEHPHLICIDASCECADFADAIHDLRLADAEIGRLRKIIRRLVSWFTSYEYMSEKKSCKSCGMKADGIHAPIKHKNCVVIEAQAAPEEPS